MAQHVTHTPDHVHVVHRNWTPAHITYSLLDIIEVFLALRLVLKLFGANTGSAIVQFLYGVTQPLVAPFAGIFPAPENIFFEWGTVVAMLAYAILVYLIVRLLNWD